MNIESKARAGFSSIMLRGGRMTKWKGQVASYAPQVGHLQSVSVAAMAAALAFGGAMAVPSEAQAQDVTVVVDSGAPAPVAEVNNGDGALAELYDVEILPGIACPMALSPSSPEIMNFLTWEGSSLAVAG